MFTFPGIADGKWLIAKSNTIYNSDIIFYTWTLIIKRLKKKKPNNTDIFVAMSNLYVQHMTVLLECNQ